MRGFGPLAQACRYAPSGFEIGQPRSYSIRGEATRRSNAAQGFRRPIGSGIALLIALLGERGLILSTFNAHLPLTHDGLIALLKFLQRCYGQFEFGRL